MKIIILITTLITSLASFAQTVDVSVEEVPSEKKELVLTADKVEEYSATNEVIITNPRIIEKPSDKVWLINSSWQFDEALLEASLVCKKLGYGKLLERTPITLNHPIDRHNKGIISAWKKSFFIQEVLRDYLADLVILSQVKCKLGDSKKKENTVKL